jgi:hypothetical protein
MTSLPAGLLFAWLLLPAFCCRPFFQPPRRAEIRGGCLTKRNAWHGSGWPPREAQNPTVQTVDVGSKIISLPAGFAERPEEQISPDFLPQTGGPTAVAKARDFWRPRQRHRPGEPVSKPARTVPEVAQSWKRIGTLPLSQQVLKPHRQRTVLRVRQRASTRFVCCQSTYVFSTSVGRGVPLPFAPRG